MPQKFDAYDMSSHLPAETYPARPTGSEQVRSGADREALFFDASETLSDATHDAPAPEAVLRQLGVTISVILGLCILIELLLAAYGVPAP
jgi:hypothetical protein